MDKLIAALLSKSWGRSFIGFTYAALLACLAGLGAAYLALYNDYKMVQQTLHQEVREQQQRSEMFWQERLKEIKQMHSRLDSISARGAIKIKKRNR